jgi:hypothetical protein
VADLSDVEDALLQQLFLILYPNGLSAPSVLDATIHLYRGWPIPLALNSDISSGITNVSVFPLPGSTRNTTRWGSATYLVTSGSALLVSASLNTVSFSGFTAAGQLAGVLIDNAAYVYAVQAGDTPGLVAASLAALIRVDRICLLSGTMITVSGATRIIARTTAAADELQEWGRQEQGLRVSVWAPSPIIRDTICGVIGGAMAPVNFLTLADTTSARIRYRSTATLDDGRDSYTYRRDIVYDVEYATTTPLTQPTMLFGDLVWNGTATFG